MEKDHVPFVEKPFEDLTKEDIKGMIRARYRKMIFPKDFCSYYKIDYKQYDEMLSKHNFKRNVYDRHFWSSSRENEEKEKGKLDLPINNFQKRREISPLTVCAIYNIPIEAKGHSYYYDVELYNKALEDIDNKLWQYEMKILDKEDSVEYSELKLIDLYALRVYRQINRKEFSKTSGLSLEDIKMYEKKGAKIPKEIEKVYFKTLDVKRRHVGQLRQIMSGKSDKVVEDRTIPKRVRIAVWSRDKGRCTKCGVEENLHYHHIQHFADGGQNSIDNLTLLCASCHAEEHKEDKSYFMLKKLADEGERS